MRNAMILFGALIVSTATITAQSSSSSQSPTKPLSFVGCLEQSQRATTAESGAFILNTPTPSTATTDTRKGTPEDPASNARAVVPPLDAGDTGRAESKIANVFVLDGSSSDLAKHVGHKVEVTGLLKPAVTPAQSAATSSTAAAPAAAVPHLQVSAVKMVAASCSGN
jgi:hypothetical protein